MSEEGKKYNPSKIKPTIIPTPRSQTNKKTQTKNPNPVNADPASRRFNRKIFSQETNH